MRIRKTIAGTYTRSLFSGLIFSRYDFNHTLYFLTLLAIINKSFFILTSRIKDLKFFQMNCQVFTNNKKYIIPFLTGFILINLSCSKESDFNIVLDESTNDQNPVVEIKNLQPGIALTFDDAYFDDWIKMLPIFQKYNAKASFFISLNYPVKKIDYKEKILKLYDSGNEIGIHTMNHPHLSDYLKHHSLTYYYHHEILPEVNYLKKIGINPTSFAYPYGEQNPESNTFLSQYFNKIRCMYGGSYIKTTKKVIGSSVILSSDLNDYKSEILCANLNSSIWVLVEHKPVQKVTGTDTFTFSMLDSICRFVSEHNMRFYCLNEIDSLILEKQIIK